MKRVVQKYGGSSVADLDKIRHVAQRISQKKEEGYQMVVVVSAMGKTTNSLIAMAEALSNEPSKREMDMLLATGEQTTIALLAIALEEMGHPAISLTGKQAGVCTQGVHTKNRISEVQTHRIERHLSEGKIVIIAGFQGVNEADDITTLGRGGSDTSAVAIAARLGCPCQIYTDVDGIYAADPRILPGAKKLLTIRFEEMMEMSCLGAKVMEPRAVEIASRYKVPLYVASSIEDITGTMIQEGGEEMEENAITGMSLAEEVLMVTIDQLSIGEGEVARIFQSLAEEQVNIDMISQTLPQQNKVRLSFTAPSSDEAVIQRVLAQVVPKEAVVQISSDRVKLSVVGCGMRNQSGVAARLFRMLAAENIEIQQISTSEISISYIMSRQDASRALAVIGGELGLQTQEIAV